MIKSVCEAFIAVAILVFTLLYMAYNSIWMLWAVVVAAIGLFLHSFMCATCFAKRRG